MTVRYELEKRLRSVKAQRWKLTWTWWRNCSLVMEVGSKMLQRWQPISSLVTLTIFCKVVKRSN